MDYRIEKKDMMSFVGSTREISTKDGQNYVMIPKFWEEFNTLEGSQEVIANIGQMGFVGAMWDYSEEKASMQYMIGVESYGDMKDEKIEILNIPETTWAVFPSKGKLPEAIQDVWKRIYNEFFPGTNYEHAMLPELEIYPDGDTTSPDYYCEVWIPIIEK